MAYFVHASPDALPPQQPVGFEAHSANVTDALSMLSMGPPPPGPAGIPLPPVGAAPPAPAHATMAHLSYSPTPSPPAVDTLAVDQYAPIAAYIGVTVEHDDCVLAGAGSLFMPAAQTLSAAPELGKIRGEVYVQAAKDVTRFRPVPADRIRRAYKIGEAHARGGSDSHVETGKARSKSYLETSAKVQNGISPLDADARFLRISDAADYDILELMLGTRHCEAVSKFFFFVCQCFVGGLCAAIGFISGGVQGEPLGDVLRVVEPGFLRLTLVLGQIMLVGCILDAFQSLELLQEERQKARNAGIGLDSGIGESNAGSTPGGRAAMRQLMRNSLSVAANSGLVLMGLMGSRGDVVLRHGNVSSASTWSWDAEETHGLLTATAVFGLMGMALALPRGQELMGNAHLTSIEHGQHNNMDLSLDSGVANGYIHGSTVALGNTTLLGSTIADASTFNVSTLDTSWRS